MTHSSPYPIHHTPLRSPRAGRHPALAPGVAAAAGDGGAGGLPGLLQVRHQPRPALSPRPALQDGRRGGEGQREKAKCGMFMLTCLPLVVRPPHSLQHHQQQAQACHYARAARPHRRHSVPPHALLERWVAVIGLRLLLTPPSSPKATATRARCRGTSAKSSFSSEVRSDSHPCVNRCSHLPQLVHTAYEEYGKNFHFIHLMVGLGPSSTVRDPSI